MKGLRVQYSDARANTHSKFTPARPLDALLAKNEEERVHIHVICDGKEAKYWLEPQIELAKNIGFPEHKLNEIKKIVEKYADSFKQQFRDHVGKRVDD